MTCNRVEPLAIQECYETIDDIRAVIHDQNSCFHDQVSSLVVYCRADRITMYGFSGCTILYAAMVFKDNGVTGERSVPGFGTRHLSLDLLEPVFLKLDVRLHALYGT